MKELGSKQHFLRTLLQLLSVFVVVFPHSKLSNTLSALLSITLFNLMYEYVIYVARPEDINLFCWEREG